MNNREQNLMELEESRRTIGKKTKLEHESRYFSQAIKT